MDFGTVTTWTQGEYMHFEILVEDISGKTTLEILVPKIINSEQHTFNIHAYKERLPQLIQGYGKTFASYPPNYHAVLIIICDLDDRYLSAFRQELLNIVDSCEPKPKTQFCIAIEEGEAWYLGDLAAVKAAYPSVKLITLNSYTNDDICGTWEKLADAVYPGGYQKLSKLPYQVRGREKTTWAEKISPLMDINNNQSPSFCYFQDQLRRLSGE